MKKLFLASSINFVASDIVKQFSQPVKKLKTAFISTAAEVEKDNLQWLKDDRQGLVEAGFNLFDYTITNKTPKDLKKDLSDVDIIHVNGGNTFYLLFQARKSGFDKFVKEAVEKGKTYIGSSAGSIIASPNIEIARTIEPRMYKKELKTFESFNLVDFIALPHWGSKDFKDLYLRRGLEATYEIKNKIILLTDYQYIYVEGDKYQIIDVKKD